MFPGLSHRRGAEDAERSVEDGLPALYRSSLLKKNPDKWHRPLACVNGRDACSTSERITSLSRHQDA